MSLDAHESHRWEDGVLIPELLDVPGVAGAWTFSLVRHQDNGLRLRAQDAATEARRRARKVAPAASGMKVIPDKRKKAEKHKKDWTKEGAEI